MEETKKLLRELFDICMKVEIETDISVDFNFDSMPSLFLNPGSRNKITIIGHTDVHIKEYGPDNIYKEKKGNLGRLRKAIKAMKEVYKNRALEIANSGCCNEACIEYDTEYSQNCVRSVSYVLYCDKRI